MSVIVVSALTALVTSLIISLVDVLLHSDPKRQTPAILEATRRAFDGPPRT